jgi:hypothetical protein
LNLKSGNRIQFDVFIPEKKLAFEWQEEHLFKNVAGSQQRQYSEEEIEKRTIFKEKGITLIDVPYWWDLKAETLKATIHFHRPDLLSSSIGNAISKEPPVNLIPKDVEFPKLNQMKETDFLDISTSNAPVGFWNSAKNQRFYFDWLGKKLGYIVMDDWYKITPEDILQRKGSYLLRKYGGSPLKALQFVYPDHEWLLWRFVRVPTGFWDKEENQRKFFEWVGRQLGFTKLDDWYQITKEIIVKYGGGGLLHDRYGGSPSTAMQYIFPEHDWKLEKFHFKSKTRF